MPNTLSCELISWRVFVPKEGAAPQSPHHSKYKGKHTVKMHRAEEIWCQTRRRVRSLLSVNEELAYRSAVQNLPAICFFT